MGNCSQKFLIDIGLVLEIGYGTLERIRDKQHSMKENFSFRYITFEINNSILRCFDHYFVCVIHRIVWWWIDLVRNNHKLIENVLNSNNKSVLNWEFDQFQWKILGMSSIYFDRIQVNVEGDFPIHVLNYSINDKMMVNFSTIEYLHRVYFQHLNENKKKFHFPVWNLFLPDIKPVGFVSRIRFMTVRSFRVPAKGWKGNSPERIFNEKLSDKIWLTNR